MAIEPSRIASLGRFRATEPPPPGDIYEQALGYVGYHAEHKRRIAMLDAIVQGRWSTVWPDDTVTEDMPKIGDLITSDLDDIANLVGGIEPTVSVPPDSDRPQDVRRAILRQRILQTYRVHNRLATKRRWVALDLAGTGLACYVIWPDHASGYPAYVRKDPRHVYPDPSMLHPDEVSSLVVAYKVKVRVLAHLYPDITQRLYSGDELRKHDPMGDSVDVVEYYDADWCIKVAGRTYSRGAKTQRSATVLAAIPNLLGCPLVTLAVRPTPDGRFRGQFDKAIPPLGTANRLMELHLAQIADEVFAEKIVRGHFDNPNDIGPGATLYTSDPNANIERVQPAGSHPQLYNDIQLMLQQSREASGVPPARSGNVQQAIASGEFVSAVQGKYITAVANYQGLVADMEQRANELALRVDELYLDFPDKPLAAIPGGSGAPRTYTPSRDIAGRYENRVTYGAGAGLDAYNRGIAIKQDVQFGIISRRMAREQLHGDIDVLAVEAEVAREQMEQGFVAAMADPSTPMDMRLRAMALFSEGRPVLEVARIMFEEMQAQQEQQRAVQEALAPPAPAAAPEALAERLPPLPALLGRR